MYNVCVMCELVSVARTCVHVCVPSFPHWEKYAEALTVRQEETGKAKNEVYGCG